MDPKHLAAIQKTLDYSTVTLVGTLTCTAFLQKTYKSTKSLQKNLTCSNYPITHTHTHTAAMPNSYFNL